MHTRAPERPRSHPGLLIALIGLVFLAAIAVPVGVAAARGGGLSVVFDEAEFLSARRVATTETFDHPQDFDATRQIVNFQGVKYRSIDGADPSWNVGGDCPTQCALSRGFREGPATDVGATLAFRDGGAVYSVGFELIPFGSPNQFVIRVVDINDEITSFRLPGSAGATYIGLHSGVGIRKITILQRYDLADGVLTNFSIDNVSRSGIFSPS